MRFTKVAKLFVSNTSSSMTVLLYLNDNIVHLKKSGIYVNIIYIKDKDFDQAKSNKMRELGITRLPTMMLPSGKMFVGFDEISRAIDTMTSGGKFDATISEDTNDINVYYKRLMHDQNDDNNQDDQAIGEEGIDTNFRERMKTHMDKRRGPSHGSRRVDDAPPSHEESEGSDDEQRPPQRSSARSHSGASGLVKLKDRRPIAPDANRMSDSGQTRDDDSRLLDTWIMNSGIEL